MIERKTLFVVGAGASSELKFPTGSELKKKITAFLGKGSEYNYDMGSNFNAIIRNRVGIRDTEGYQCYEAAAERVISRLSLVDSIDEFLADKRDDPLVQW